MSAKDDEPVVPEPLLYDLYHETDYTFEKEAIKRLIEFQLPDVMSDCFATQYKYEKCREVLFTKLILDFLESRETEELVAYLRHNRRFSVLRTSFGTAITVLAWHNGSN